MAFDPRGCALGEGPLWPCSGDGRTNPWGGFCIGTMDQEAAPQAGAIMRQPLNAGGRRTGPATILNLVHASAAQGQTISTQLDHKGQPEHAR